MWREEPLKRVAVKNRFLRPLRVRQFHSFGAQSLIDHPAWLYGTHHISIGQQVIILRGAWLSVERTAWDKPDPALTIEDGVGIRNGCTISAAESIVIEQHVAMAGYVSLIDSKHTWDAGHPNPIWNPLETAPIRIGPSTFIGERVTVTAGTDIGERCFIGANATVSGKIPDHSIVLGNPGRIVGSTRT